MAGKSTQFDEQPSVVLVKAATSRNRKAFDHLCDPDSVQRWLVVITLLLPKSMRSKIDPEDVLQETLHRAWTSVETLQDASRAGFHRWVVGISKHVVSDFTRQFKKQKRDISREEQYDATADSATFKITATPSRFIAKREITSKVVGYLNELKPIYRDVIVSRILEGHTTKQVAEILGTTTDNVSVLLHRALVQFRGLVEDQGILSTLFRRL